MNIVQLQYKLRDLPMSAVQAAANGQNPEIPEVLATMEMNRRERMEKANAKPPAKSIKEQLEQKLTSQPQEKMGLPGMLQQAQQANGEPQQDQVQQEGQPQMPQMAQQAAPQQSGMPQQPGQEPQQLRMGGVAGLPSTMFKQFNSGGIVAFAEGDLVANDDQSAAEVARLKRAEEIAAARELLDVTGSNPPAEPQARSMAAPEPALSPEAARVTQEIRNAPFVQETLGAVRDMEANIQETTPEQEMEKKKALLAQYGIRQPGEDELARIASSREAYDRDRQERAQYQALRALAAGARPNAYGRYMPGTIGETVSGFGLSNLEADRNFREANDKSEVAAKESQRAFELGNLNDSIKKSDESKQYKREAAKTKATIIGQMASSGITAFEQGMNRSEEIRYHNMWKDIKDKELKIQAAQAANQAQQNIPEFMRNIENLEKKYPELMKTFDPKQKIELAVEIITANRGIPARAQTAYDQEITRIDALRAKDRESRGAKLLETTLAQLRLSGKDPEKIKNIENQLSDIDKKVAEKHKYPEPPKGGLAALQQSAPAPEKSEKPNPEKTDKSKSKDTTIKYDNQGRIISQ